MAVNKTELLQECNNRVGKEITRGWVDSFVKSQADHLFETESTPQENPRLEVPQIVLEAAVQGLRVYVYNACTELAFNLDEIGISELEDRTEGKVIVPSTMRWQTICHDTRGDLKPISVMVCISAAG
jgi:hypothetical protein